MEGVVLPTFFGSVVGHLIGDFALQTTGMATKKAFLNWYMLSHCLVVSFTTIIPFFLVAPFSYILLIYIIILVSHIISDNAKKFITDIVKNKNHFVWIVLACDQVFHVSIIYLLVILFLA